MRWGSVSPFRVAPMESLMGAPSTSPVVIVCRDSFGGDGDNNVEGGESMRAVNL